MSNPPVQPGSRVFEAWVAAAATAVFLFFGQLVGWMLVEALFYIGFDWVAAALAYLLIAVVYPVQWLLNALTGQRFAAISPLPRAILLAVAAILFWSLIVFALRFFWLVVKPLAPIQNPPPTAPPAPSSRAERRAQRKAMRQRGQT